MRPVRMVIPIGPGSSMDITARLLGQRLYDLWERADDEVQRIVSTP